MKLRPINSNDKFLVEKWIAKDDDHSNRCDAAFFTKADAGKSECFAVEDDIGTIMYIRVESVARFHVQFDCTERERTREALKSFVPEIEKLLKPRYTQIIWESVSKPLISFMSKFGYKHSQDEYTKDLCQSIPAELTKTTNL
jgi:hypothetical protein